MNVKLTVLIALAATCQLVFTQNMVGWAQGGLGHKAETQSMKVVLQRVYLDGDICEEVVLEQNKSIKQIKGKYHLWQLVDQKGDHLVFRTKVDDISPLLKANGYFGITDEGILTIFNGKPEDSKVIHSFFQIDLGKLESRKREQLKNGIPIKTKDRYQQVLETFKPYSKQG